MADLQFSLLFIVAIVGKIVIGASRRSAKNRERRLRILPPKLLHLASSRPPADSLVAEEQETASQRDED
jgi:hypothetical protein